MKPQHPTPQSRVARDFICHDAGLDRIFVAFNCGELTIEPVSDTDIIPIKLRSGSAEESQAWSANASWYFINTEAGIILGRVGSTHGVICLRKSFKFIEAFIDAPRSKPNRKGTS